MIWLEESLARLATCTSAELKDEWRSLTKSPAPRISPKMMRLALAWEMQAKAFGGVSRETIRKLDQLAASKTRTSPVSPGMRLVREWGGKVHVVTVGEDRIIRWQDAEYRSLSEVAKAITGTHWSGPAFFGLKRKAAA
ncbi:MAG: hypothetical protein JWQ89_1539 [Devosia sp.]|uniref:DUF2924 domain-containing protein n=1 Tax=Devosia sp. TaxID=1871048 RepID=UPI0026378DB1|nr:DUF2924 domain-containing protein [Devosia sp.]MDB5539812.1 hypothetical protein [Devosia sp.]